MRDIVIIGAGVSGTAAARELSRYQADILLLDKEEDVCYGTSKANSAIVHAGFDAEPGTLMAKLNVEGNRMMPALAEELEFPFKQNGSLVVCTDASERGHLEELLAQGQANGVEGLRIVEREELVEMEPNISDGAVCALYAPTGGIVCPFNLTIAMAENAAENGVEFRMNTKVQGIRKTEQGFVISTDSGEIETKTIVNAAGVYADELHNMVSEDKMTIIARKGEYHLLDKSAGKHVSRTIFALPSRMGKGVLITPTVHGNLLVGPTASDTEDKDGVNTTAEGLAEAGSKAALTVKNVPLYSAITSFAGLRAHRPEHDFVIGEPADAPGFVDAAGIESPGLSASPAIGVMVAEILKERLQLKEKENFISKRKAPVDPKSLTIEERNALIKEKPAYGTIVCRCESVTEGEIIEAIRRPLGARSLDGVKRRTRAGMGRCQAGFCSPKVMEILAREVEDLDFTQVTKCGGASGLIVARDKDFDGREEIMG